jgi:hypothetical protein
MGEPAIFVSITGGLGNQLFGLAAGIEQATRLGCSLVLLTSNYGKPNARNFWLDKLELPDFVSIADVPPRLPWGKKRKIFSERGFDYDERILDVEPGALLQGYFQSPKYFTETQELVRQLVFPLAIRRVGDAITDKTFFALHVRRGDYLSAATRDFHGLASADYFRNGIELLERLNGKQPLIVFSDSPQHVNQEFQNLGLEYELFDPFQQKDALTTLRELSQATGIVMSNSSFSWWAAWNIDSSFESPSRHSVIAPRPWFTAGESAMDLLLPRWITLGLENG